MFLRGCSTDPPELLWCCDFGYVSLFYKGQGHSLVPPSTRESVPLSGVVILAMISNGLYFCILFRLPRED